jgi:hypothetical protein
MCGALDGLDWGHINMLNTLLCLKLGVDSGSSSSYNGISIVDELLWKWRAKFSPAAAAGSCPSFLGAGLSEALDMGLLLRLVSGLLAGGDLERRSNLEVLLGSGSFWSKRERFAVRRSVSSIFNTFCGCEIVIKKCAQRCAYKFQGCK